MRVKVTNSQTADQEEGYRLRVRMAHDMNDPGKYKIDTLQQVTS